MSDIMICNYETLLDDRVLEELLNKNLECILTDESQYFRSKDAERSKALYKLNKAKVKIGATATPITKDPRDIYGLFKFINPDLLGSYNNFSKKYIKWAGFGKINGFKNMDQLRDLIANDIIIKTKEEISGQLPSLNVIKKYIDMDTKILEMHNRLMEELDKLNDMDFNIRSKCKSELEVMNNEELAKIEAKIMALQTFAQEIADSPLLLEMSDSEMAKEYCIKTKSNAKLELCLELISEIIDSGEKVCIFSKFERMQKILTDAILKNYKDIKIAYVNGSLNSTQRYEEAYTKFRDNDDYKVLLMSDSGAEGINLSRCKYLIEYELSSSYAIQTQKHGRLERADSVHNSVTVYQLIARDTWDQIQEKIIDKKEAFDIDIIKSIAKK